MSVEQFINRFGGFTESYWFYNNSIELRYDPKQHIYYRVTGDELLPQDGVTSVCHIIDKSEVLIPWACKMMAGKLLAEVTTMTLPTGERLVRQMTYEEYEKLILSGKSAHKEKLEDAGAVGHAAHAWIEGYIKAKIAGAAFFAVPFPEDERAANACRAALDWMRRHNVRWLHTERKIFSRQHGYAGTMDGLCRIDSCDDPLCCPEPFKDRLSVADWKTSNALHIEYLLQTAAYMQAYNEEMLHVPRHRDDPVDFAVDRWVIRLGKDDGEFQAWHAPRDTYDQDLDGFLLALGLRRMVAAVKARVKQREDAIREVYKAKAKEERDRLREAALKLKCPNADKYKGSRKPMCNKGNPCESCLSKYAEVQAAKRDNLSQSVSNTA